MPDTTLQFTGTIEKIFFQNERGYVIGRLHDEETGRKIRFRGSLGPVMEGQYWQIEGEWVTHPTYGEQIEVRAAAPAKKPVAETLVRYLSGSRFEGVGVKTAQKIVETLGETCIEKILKNPSVLETKCHIKSETADAIVAELQKLNTLGNRITQLLSWGLTQNELDLLEELSPKQLAQLDEDPFFPYYELRGFGYQGGLKLADGFQLERQDPKRIEAFVLHELTQMCYRTGSTCIEKAALLSRLGLDPVQFDQALQHLRLRGLATEHEGLVYLFELYISETVIASGIVRHTFPVEKIEDSVLEKTLEQIQQKINIEYDPTQKQAIKTFFSSSIMILNGGPGTGKSTILLGLLKAIHELYPSEPITLCAPTGRAARRMKDLAHVPARTIHSLLKWNAASDSFSVDERDPVNCRFLIVDECSMVDSRLFASLMRAVPDECQILLIGDEDQLESVGPGNVLRDLIACGKIPLVRLETLHRQKEGSGIPILAAQIRKEEPVTFLDPVDFLQPQGSTLACLKDRLMLEASPEDLQVLAPKYAGISGIYAINAMMQEIINPFDPRKAQMTTHISTPEGRLEIVYREDDKVLLKRNLTELGVYNGDIGRIVEINLAEKLIIVDFGEDEENLVEFEKSELNLLSHAWCISIHKSQGSEYQKACVIADGNGIGMLRKRLLYTAVSRAKASLTIIGEESLFRMGALQNDENRRHTTLVRRIQEAFVKEQMAARTVRSRLGSRKRIEPDDETEKADGSRPAPDLPD